MRIMAISVKNDLWFLFVTTCLALAPFCPCGCTDNKVNPTTLGNQDAFAKYPIDSEHWVLIWFVLRNSPLALEEVAKVSYFTISGGHGKVPLAEKFQRAVPYG